MASPGSSASRAAMARPPPQLITVSGIDCAGKSTQIALLAEALRAHGHQRVRVFWYRPGYSDELDALRALVRRVRPGALPRAESAPEARARLFDKGSVRHTWLAMALVDTLAQYGAKLRAFLARGETVICDRYVHDGLLDLKLKFPELGDLHDVFARTLPKMCPTPDTALLLMLPKHVMLERMAQKREPFPDSEAIRDARYAAYEELGRSGRFHVLDAAQAVEALHQDMMRAVNARS